jgi:hypothetical protein
MHPFPSRPTFSLYYQVVIVTKCSFSLTDDQTRFAVQTKHIVEMTICPKTALRSPSLFTCCWLLTLTTGPPPVDDLLQHEWISPRQLSFAQTTNAMPEAAPIKRDAVCHKRIRGLRWCFCPIL